MSPSSTGYDKNLMTLALDLTTGISAKDRFERLLETVRHLFRCDASALLIFKKQRFVPLAIDGLSADVLGRHFSIEEHPRLEAIARAGDIVRFPADSHLPDPYDNLIESHKDELKVHACVGLPLIADQCLIGALTIDAFDPQKFDSFSDKELRIVSALASASLNNALLMERLEKLAANLPGSEAISQDSHSQKEIIGRSVSMQQLKMEISVVAETDMTALILGETGVGKELVANAIHNESPRAHQPMVYLNCAALPESVAESELFGHVKGAFTGAISNRKGKFELADQGTLFLDEVGELSLALQSKLLRVLQYGDIQRIGDDRSLRVNTRIVAATNKNLKQEVMEGRFRSDLYHRLSVFPIAVPPLRERDNDIILLAGYFTEKCRSKIGLEHLTLSASCQKSLLAYSWPGNVRELEHTIYRAAILAKAGARSKYVSITPEYLATQLRQEGQVLSSKRSVKSPVQLTEGIQNLRDATDDFQRQFIRETLENSDNSWAAAARALGVDSGNLHRLAKRLGLK